MRVGKIGVVIIGLVPFNVYAVPCTPAPDCASIGYTETSCETISLKCPFDQTKLYCFPCDSSYQYTCDAINEYCEKNNCEPISVASDKFGNLIVVVKYLD